MDWNESSNSIYPEFMHIPNVELINTKHIKQLGERINYKIISIGDMMIEHRKKIVQKIILSNAVRSY